MNQQQIELFQSKKSDDWATPDYLYRQLNYEFNFNLDPCPLNADFNGLEIPWTGSVFVNPPYSKVRQFLLKAHEELRGGQVRIIVFLLFANTDTAWFHDLIYGKAEIRFIRGRIAFTGKHSKGNSAMRPSMICIFRSSGDTPQTSNH